MDSIVIEQNIIRLILTVAIFRSHTIPVKTKITLIYAIDFVKNIYFLFRLEKLPVLVTNELYQKLDKVLDLLAYFCILCLIPYAHEFTPVQQKVLNVVFYIRVVGVFAMLKSSDRSMLAYFPDLFKETLFAFYLYDEGWISRHNSFVVLAVFVTIKIYLERRFHFQKLGLLDLFDNLSSGLDSL
jgi:hypothetical protein